MKTRTASVPAPVLGWNTRDALADMDPRHAVRMDNWFCDDDQVSLRRGTDAHATGLGSAVETLIEYNALTGANKLFAAAGTAIYDVTSAGAVGAAVQSGLTNARFQYVNIGTAGGQFVWLVNGADAPRHWNGTTWAQPTLTGISDPTKLVWVNLHQRRIFAGTTDSLSAWYLPVNSISGTMTEFPLAALCKRGGYLMGMLTWSRDSGQGMDDLAVFVTSEGEAVVYSGTDPANASAWFLEGVFRIGKPIGRRFYTKYGADAVLITEDGFLPLSTVLSIERGTQSNRAISDQISKTVNDSVRSYKAIFGWDAIVYPQARMLIFNVPQGASVSHQYVFNTTSLAPSRFIGMQAKCWALLNDDLYYGGVDGTVYKADTGTSDNGTNITADLKPAFSYFGNKGALKLFKMARPIFSSNGNFQAAFDLNVDFADAIPTSTPTFANPNATLWNQFNWNEANWASSDSISKDWQSVSGIGYAAALRVRTVSKDFSIALRSIDYLYEVGGTL